MMLRRLVLIMVMLAVAAPASSASVAPSLTAFRNRAELAAFLTGIQKTRDAANLRRWGPAGPPPPPPPPPPAPPPPPEPGQVTANFAASDTITNTQVAGVDEGGIVKARGDLLIVLRRGRLFTVSTANGGMKPVAAIDAVAPGVDGRSDWYDEMLVAGDTVAVIGYSYRRGGTQVNRFRLGLNGELSFLDAYTLRSSDYYSSRNYASRLIGNRLVLYAPMFLNVFSLDRGFPSLTRWRGATADPMKPLWQASRVFLPERLRRAGPWAIDTVHSVTSCDLTAPELNCTATAILGNSARTFFVSQNAVYIWSGLNPGLSSDFEVPKAGPAAMLYRLPFDAARPRAVAVRGQPIDQFSFFADTRRSALQVVVGSASGDAMWGPEWTAGKLSLVTIPTGLFGSGATEVPRANYQLLPGKAGWGTQNRFVGDYLLYGLNEESKAARPALRVLSLASRVVTRIELPHRADRLDAIGPDAIVVGQGNRFLGFSAIDLSGTPSLAAEFRLPDAAEGEARSQAFFFQPDPRDASGRSGLLGLPVARALRNQFGFQNSAAVAFLRRDGRDLRANGELAAAPAEQRDDACKASCVDWYGNARPIFRGPRIFALLGYELVEGRAGNGRMDEVGRVDMSSLISTPPR
jgi:hypothetical protein